MMCELLNAVRQGDRRALARAITVAEQGGANAEVLFKDLSGQAGHALRVGITGPPGVGKSVLVGVLISFFRSLNKRVGVLAVDPSSPVSGGAVLGDRLRMEDAAAGSDVFVRSMASRGVLGGIAVASGFAMDLMDASGLDILLLETVGIGQSEVDVMHCTDCVLLVLQVDAGDSIQSIKAGVMEIGDIVALNKCDLPGAEKAAAAVATGLHLRKGDPVDVLQVSAKNNTGVEALGRACLTWCAAREASGDLQGRRDEGLLQRFRFLFESKLQQVGTDRMDWDYVSKCLQGGEMDMMSLLRECLGSLGMTEES